MAFSPLTFPVEIQKMLSQNFTQQCYSLLVVHFAPLACSSKSGSQILFPFTSYLIFIFPVKVLLQEQTR